MKNETVADVMSEAQEENHEGQKIRVNTVQNVFRQMKDVASLEIRKPIISRLRSRLKEIQEMSKAKIVKIPTGATHQFITEPPKMFISGLDGRVENGKGIITYNVYETEKTTDGLKKKLHLKKQEMTNMDGKTETRIVDAQYRFEHTVVETIEFMKPIQTEVFKYEK